MKRLVHVAVVVTVAVIALLAGPAVWADEGGIPAEPVQAKPVGHGLTLWVHVFYAKGGNGNGGPPRGGTVNCTDTNTQTGYAAPFAFANTSGLGFQVNNATIPSGLAAAGVDTALSSAAGAWNSAGSGSVLATSSDGSATSPVQDGTSTIGWARLVPKTVLAATWTWTDASTNRIVEADIFYNNMQPWAVLTGCPSSRTGKFDVADIGTHELGHALGLSHHSDSDAQATMYPSAPSDEVRKTTLTAGDKSALVASLAG